MRLGMDTYKNETVPYCNSTVIMIFYCIITL